MRICRVATIPFQLSYVSHQIGYFLDQGDEVVLVSGQIPEQSAFDSRATHYQIPLRRTISPYHDLVALLSLARVLRAGKFDVVHSVSPKAGLLTAIAGRLVGTPVRVHTWTGQPWANQEQGIGRSFMKMMDRLILRLNTGCFCDSPSQRDFLISENIGGTGEVNVIGIGSVAGVDLEKFVRTPAIEEAGLSIRKELGIGKSDVLITFVGRLTPEKGLNELVDAFGMLLAKNPQSHLLLVGPSDADLGRETALRFDLALLPDRVYYAGSTSTPEAYYAASDILCLPSYREGFGSVVIEAAAMGVPCVGTMIYGLIDAVEHGETGILVPPRDVAALAGALESLIQDEDKRRAFGRAARGRAVESFDAQLVSKEVRDSYIASRQRPSSALSLESGRRLVLVSLNSRPPNYVSGLLASLPSSVNYDMLTPVDLPGAEADRCIKTPLGSNWAELASPLRILRLVLETAQLVRRSKGRPIVHLVSTHPWSPLVLATSRLLGAEVIVTRHDAFPHPGEESRTVSVLHGLEARLAHIVLIPSIAVADQLAGHAFSRKIVVVPLPKGLRPSTVRLRGPEERFNWMFIGRIHEYKGVDLLVATFERLKPVWPEIVLTIAGDDPKGLLKELGTDASGLVVRVGWMSQQEIAELLDQSGLVVLPYREASQSAVAMEAFAHGVPVVATPVGGLPEQVAHGKTGLLAEAASVDALSETLGRLLGDPKLYVRLVDAVVGSDDIGGATYRQFIVNRLEVDLD